MGHMYNGTDKLIRRDDVEYIDKDVDVVCDDVMVIMKERKDHRHGGRARSVFTVDPFDDARNPSNGLRNNKNHTDFYLHPAFRKVISQDPFYSSSEFSDEESVKHRKYQSSGTKRYTTPVRRKLSPKPHGGNGADFLDGDSIIENDSNASIEPFVAPIVPSSPSKANAKKGNCDDTCTPMLTRIKNFFRRVIFRFKRVFLVRSKKPGKLALLEDLEDDEEAREDTAENENGAIAPGKLNMFNSTSLTTDDGTACEPYDTVDDTPKSRVSSRTNRRGIKSKVPHITINPFPGD